MVKTSGYTPLVSVLMTAYNREKFISEAIESLLATNFQEWELIIVDDQSTDKTMEIARSYEKKDKRIKVYRNETNLGDYPNRNQAASFAIGKYIKYLDSDDYIYPNWFDVMVPAMENHPEAGLGLNRFVRNSPNPGPFYFNSKDAWKRHFFVTPVFVASPLSAIIRKETYDKVGGFSEIRYGGDHDMWFKLTAVSGLIIAEHPLAESRVHEGQEKSKGENYYLVTGKNIEKEHLKSVQCPICEKEKDKALRLIDIGHTNKFLHYLGKGQLHTAILLWKSYQLNLYKIISILIQRLKLGKGFYTKLQKESTL